VSLGLWSVFLRGGDILQERPSAIYNHVYLSRTIIESYINFSATKVVVAEFSASIALC
jgi:hypothetical protein